MKEVYFLYNSNSRINIFLQVLGEGNFHLLTHHVVIGNQVIIRGSYKETIKLILHALMVSVYIKKTGLKPQINITLKHVQRSTLKCL